MQGVREECSLPMLLYIISAKVLANFIDANKEIKGMQKGDHVIKTVNFADSTTMSLRDVTCLNTGYK